MSVTLPIQKRNRPTRLRWWRVFRRPSRADNRSPGSAENRRKSFVITSACRQSMATGAPSNTKHRQVNPFDSPTIRLGCAAGRFCHHRYSNPASICLILLARSSSESAGVWVLSSDSRSGLFEIPNKPLKLGEFVGDIAHGDPIAVKFVSVDIGDRHDLLFSCRGR